MFTQFKKMVKDCLTENDGQSYCIGRVTLATAIATGLPTLCVGALYSVYANPDHHFPMQEFGIGFAAILAGLATAVTSIAMKQRTDTPGTSAQS